MTVTGQTSTRLDDENAQLFRDVVTVDDTVATPCLGYKRMELHWDLIHDLLEGVEHMRRKAEKWLPKEKNEKREAYNRRRKLTTLYSALKDTIEKHSSKPFSRPVSFKDTLPAPLDDIWGNVDHTGVDGDTFARDLFEDAETHGLTHILVDFPRTTGNESIADEERMKIRPRFIHVKAHNLLGWRSEIDSVGRNRLTQIRIREVVTVPNGPFGEIEVTRIRVIESPNEGQPGRWMVYENEEANKDNKWKLVDGGRFDMTKIPLVTIYFKPTGFMQAFPPLKKLADVNLTHYQSDSDHRNFLRFARIGVLFGSGFSQDQVDKGITISPTEAILTKSDNATLEYVEVSGESIKAGERDLERLEERMEVLGMQPLIERQSANSAASTHANEHKNITVIQSWIRATERGLRQAYEYAADWMNLKRQRVTIPEKFKVDIYSDFSVGGDPNENEFLLNAALAGKIPTKLFLKEIHRRGVISVDTDIEETLDEIEDEFPPEEMVGEGNDDTPLEGVENARKETRRSRRARLARSGPGAQSAKE